MICRFRCTSTLTCVALITTVLLADEPGGYWPQWRGPHRDNVSTDTSLLKNWPEEGPPLRWSVEGIGHGIAAVAVAQGRVYTLGYIGEHEYATALDEQSGARLWTTAIGPAVDESPLMRWLSQRTPTIDADRLYVVRTDGQLVCLSTANGRERWRKVYASEFGPSPFAWGYCDYPLVDGEQLICCPGNPQALLAALDKQTGDVLWKTPFDAPFRPSYGAVVTAELGGIPQYIACCDSCVVGIEAKTGTLLWQHRHLNPKIHGTQTPIVRGDFVLWPYGYGSSLVLLQHRDPADSGVITEIYTRTVSGNAFQDHGFVVGDYYYASDRAGQMQCIAWQTGGVQWQSERTTRQELPIPSAIGRKWSGTYADDLLYSLSISGRVMLASISPTGLHEVASFSLPEHVPALGATMPVVTGGGLYLRSDNVLYCYDVTAQPSPPSPDPVRIILSPPPADDAGPEGQPRVPRPIFVPTPQDVVVRMLELAAIEKDDHIVDLGSGDGRIVITAAKTYGCRAVGYEIDEELVKVSQQQIEAEKLSQLAEIKAEDMYTADLSEVDVVAVYVYPAVLERMKPQFAQLPAGARIVSHQFEIPGVKPVQTVEVDSAETGGRHTIYVYTAPLMVSEDSR